jgi:hypothetical protein
MTVRVIVVDNEAFECSVVIEHLLEPVIAFPGYPISDELFCVFHVRGSPSLSTHVEVRLGFGAAQFLALQHVEQQHARVFLGRPFL